MHRSFAFLVGAVLCACACAALHASPARAGTITAVGAVTALTDRSDMTGTVLEGRFDEATSGSVPLGVYSSLGLTFHTGTLSSILPGVTSPGTAWQGVYADPNIFFPAPIAGGGIQTGAITYYTGVATFSVPVTQVGLTASRNGTQYLTVWDMAGNLLGQVRWVPSSDSAFVGVDTGGVPIGMIAYGNDDVWAGASYEIGGPTIMSDTWVWSIPCDNDGVREIGEQCDDGNTMDGDGCSATCRIEYCGDGVVSGPEVCDDGNTMDGDGCAADCYSDETCGNGVVDVATGESCDDGNTADGDGCQSGCVLPTCGDGVLDAGETCDDGNTADGDGCSAGCSSDETCGNGVVDGAVGEQCDDGGTAGDDGCSATCRIEYCGDGVVQTGEVCDDGNRTSGDGCSASCDSNESCGNGVVDPAAGEQCDDGNTAGGDGCSATCQVERCGNGFVDDGEACDDGNTTDGDGCSADCHSDETCGNGVIDVAAGEACDDGNTVDGDGCQSSCALASCGDGVLDAGEVCDDGNIASGDGCNATCTSDESCGNSVVDVEAGEQCDDGNTTGGDDCSAACMLEYCGNSVIDAGELCDDGNAVSGDACSADCQSDESCGNAYVDVATGEQCDDGNTDDGDGCNASCRIEFCGNDTVDGAEICDDGNNLAGDGCAADCSSDESCGNGILDSAAGETCDDGNTDDGDGCSATCALPSCGNGVLDAGEVCDDGNTDGGDGCSATCGSDETCGNGVVDPAEACDDGNTEDGDGCAADCTVEVTMGGDDGGGCGCRTAGAAASRGAGGHALALTVLLGALLLRRRRRR